MSLLNKAASAIHKHHGWYVTNGLVNAEAGSHGSVDGDVFERLGGLAVLGHGVPAPKLKSTPRLNKWMNDDGVSVGQWKVGASLPGGKVKLTVDVDFSSSFGVACFLASYDEQTLVNNVAIGDALAALYKQPGTAWRLENRWVYTALKVKTGFMLMRQSQAARVTLSGSGMVNVQGVPVQLDLAGFQASSGSASEFAALDGVAPFVQLMAIKDGAFSKAHAEQVG